MMQSRRHVQPVFMWSSPVAREDNASAEAFARGQAIIERKIKADGSAREYSCTLMSRQRGLVVVEFARPSAALAQRGFVGGSRN